MTKKKIKIAGQLTPATPEIDPGGTLYDPNYLSFEGLRLLLVLQSRSMPP